MGLFNNFPYPDTHQLNLDWILDKLQEVSTYVEERVDGIQKALTDAQAAATAAENSAKSAQDSAESAQDAATAQPSVKQAQAAATASENSATSAQTFANNAQTSATSAQASAENAQMSVTQAQTFANNAHTSATSAHTSATSAQTSATSAQDAATRAQASATELASLLFNNAGAHNAIYRGKNLGTSVTAAQYAAISTGTFDDLYIGDYWTIGGINYRIAAFDYYLNSGDVICTTHHVVIVPDTYLYNAQMHNTSSGGFESGSANTTAGGYVGSDMYKSNLEQAKTTIKSVFSGHVLKHRIYLTTAVANGRASDGAWRDSEVDLMCDQMVYGSSIFSPVSDGINVPANYRVDKSQLPLFQHEPSRICNRETWWLRDVINNSTFSCVRSDGLANFYLSSNSFGVRPAFCIS